MSEVNNAVRQAAKEKGVFLWQIADKLCVSEMTLIRRLRHELPQDQQTDVLEAIEKIYAEKRGGSKNE